MISTKSDLTEGSVFKRLIGFTLPFLFSCFMQALYGAVDMWAIGRFGTSIDLASVNIGSQVAYVVTGFCVGVSMGTTVLIGHHVGAKNKEGAASALGNSVWIFVFLAVILTPFMIFGSGAITTLMQTPSEAVEGAVTYIKICGAGVPFIISYNVVSAILRGDGNSRMPMVFIGIACVVNIAGDIILCGAFGLGVVGVAVATISAQAVASVIGIIYLAKKGLSFKITKEGFKIHKESLKKIIFIGFPIAIQDTLINLSFVAITAIANTRCLVDASAVGVTEKIIQLMFLAPKAMLSSLSAFTSHNVGAKKGERAVLAVKYGILITFVFGMISCLLSQFAGEQLVGFFSKDSEVIYSAAQYLKTYSIDCVVVSLSFCLNGYFCGIDRSIVVFIHNAISAFLVRIPLAMLFSNMYPETMLPMGLASPIGSFVSVIICGAYLLFIYLKNKKHPALS